MSKSQKSLSMLLLLILVFGIGSGTAAHADIDTFKANGIKCFMINDVSYPAVFGEPEMSMAERLELKKEHDPVVLADEIHTVPDCLLFLKVCRIQDDGVTSDAESVLMNRSGTPTGLCNAMLYLLTGDCEESGLIKLSGSNNYALVYVRQDGLYYAFDVFRSMRMDPWMSDYPGGNYSTETLDELVDEIMTHNCNPVYTNASAVIYVNHISTAQELRVKQYLETGEYSDEEIHALAASHPSLEEAAEKLHTANDSVRFLKASGFRFGYSYCHNQHINGIGWAWGLSAEFVYDHMCGSCWGISNMMNRLLEGDYDEQGYVKYTGAHIFNYFKQDGIYCFCDFTPCLSEDGSRYTTNGDYEAYVIGAFENPLDFAEYYYLSVFPTAWNTPGEENYLNYMYMYPLDGRNSLATGTDNAIAPGNIVPSEAQDSLIELYIRDGLHLRFLDFDSDANRPEEVNIPEG